mgnify:CR=1 FL=1
MVEDAKCKTNTTNTLQAKYDTREECIHALVMKQRQKLNRNIKETLVDGWKTWAAEATELQVLQANAENR